MCGLAEASLAATVASGLVSAAGMYQQGQQKKAEMNYRAAIARNNAIRADYMAQDALKRGKIDEANQRMKGALLVGRMRAVLASSGQSINEGSAVNLVADQAGVNEYEAQVVHNNAAREAQEYQLAGQASESEALLYSISGRNAASAGAFGAGGALLSTGASVADKWYKFDKEGW